MDTIRWDTIQRLFAEALKQPGAAREDFLRAQCHGDEQLFDEVTRLLQAEQRADAFMDRMETSVNHLVWEPFRQGDVIGNYRIEGEIGSGGMGTVYKAVDQRLGRPAALKFLHVHRAGNQHDKARFIREAKAASRINHENICAIYDIAESDTGQLYIAMAYCHGRSLDHILEHSGVTPADALSITRQLSAALSEAHTAGILHRDLKPANIIVDESCKIKLVDFGIAKILGEDVTATSAGFGTAAYMAPEQFDRSPVDIRCDIWSAGCILYEMLTGRRPFPGESPAEIMHNVLNHQFPLPRAVRPELPSGFDHVISRCLARDINERFNSFQELNDALLPLQETLEALPLSVPSRTVDTGTMERKYVTALYYRLESTNDECRAMPDLASRVCQQHGGFLLHAAFEEGAMLLGYPVAEEQAGEKALRCGLQLLQQAAEMGCSIALGAHAGFILTDTGQPANRNRLLHEHPVRSAFMLCNNAAPNTLLINDRLQKQVQDNYELARQGEAFVVLSRAESRSRSRDADATPMTPLSGRYHELGILLDAWERVLEGEGQVISISGEPGIGKSRMVFELKKAVADQAGACVVECLCAPYQRNTALHPVVAYLENRLQWHAQEDADAKHASLEIFARDRGLTAEQLSLLQLLLKTESVVKGLSGETIREKTLLLVKKLLLDTAAAAPLALIFEDLHWADPTTIDLLNLLIEKGPVTGVLLVCTYRPNFQPRWHGRAHIANLSLNRLSRRDTEKMANDLLAGRGLAPELMVNVVQRTDGVPLFIEELTQAVLERLSTQPQEGQAQFIPLTLQESLQARLDALGVAKHVAQLGSVIGREFSFALLHAFAKPVNDAELEKQLDTLVRSQLVHQFGAPPEANYRFKHALIRDAAYQSLTVENRRQLHRQVAEMFLESFPKLADNQPEVLAHHFAEAGENLSSAQHWLRAGQAALQRYAVVEASSHCSNGLAQIQSLPSSADILQLELALQTTLGPALMALKGYANPEVNHAYSRAHEICRLLGDPPAVFPVLFGLWTFHCVRGLHRSAADLAQQLVDIADKTGDPSMTVAAHLVRGISHTFRGQFIAAREDYAIGLSLYKEDMAQQHIVSFGQDSGTVLLAYQTVNEWFLGDTPRANELAKKAIELGRRSEHPHSLAFALTFAAWHYMNEQQWDQAGDCLTETLSLCEKNNVQIFFVLASVLNAIRLACRSPSPELEINNIQQAITHYTSTGAGLFVPSWITVLAQFFCMVGDTDKAKAEIQRAHTLVQTNDEAWCVAEIERTAGDIAAVAGDMRKARACYQRAIEVADEQNAIPWKTKAQAALAGMEKRLAGDQQSS